MQKNLIAFDNKSRDIKMTTKATLGEKPLKHNVSVATDSTFKSISAFIGHFEMVQLNEPNSSH